MTTTQIQKHFFHELSSFYNKIELASIWNYCLDFILNLNRTFFITNPDSEIDSEKISKLEDVIQRLKTHEPIQYISGKSWFCDSVFHVNPAVLIPRPETEELVYKICETISEASLSVLDIGTGSGCIAVSIKKLKPKTNVAAVDISEEALNTAIINAVQILGDEAVSFINNDVLKSDFPSHFDTKFDIIVSNPPYIPMAEKETLHQNVLDFEPHLALFCDDDPLQFYKAIAIHAKQLLKPGGLLFFEIHENFGEQVVVFLSNQNFRDIELIKDFQGKNRIIKAINIE